MIFLVFLFFIIDAKIEDPKLAIILFDYYASDSDVYKLQEKYTERVQEIKNMCKDNMDSLIYQRLCKPNAYINQVLVANRKNYYLNLQLTKVDTSNDILFINAYDYKGDIMLNFLKKKMIVTISKSLVTSKLLNDHNGYYDENDSFDSLLNLLANVSYDGSFQSQSKLVNALVPKDQIINTKAQYLNEIDLYGNIKNKVSFLTVVNFRVNFVSNNMNCENVFLHSCYVGYQQYGIKNDFIIVDESTNGYITSEQELFKTSQYGLYLVDYTEGKIRVSYMSSQWNIFREDSQILSVPYDIADKLGILTYVDEIEIHNSGEQIPEIKPLNITLVYEINVWIPNLQEEKKKVKITYIGWDGNKPEVDIIYDATKIDVENNDGGSDGSKLDKIEILIISAIVVLSVIVVTVIVIIVVCVVKKKKTKTNKKSTEEGES